MVEPIARQLFVEFRVSRVKRKMSDEIQSQREAAEQRRDKMTIGRRSVCARAFRQRNAAANMSYELNNQPCGVSFSKAVISITRR